MRGTVAGGGGPARGRIIDKYPNYMSGSTTTSAADTFTSERVETPISRLKQGKGNAVTVMELLKVDLDVEDEDFLDTTATTQWIWEMSIGATPTASSAISNPQVITRMRKAYQASETTDGAMAISWKSPTTFNFQDENGFGYLLATDSFHVSVDTTNYGTTATFHWRIFYRFVNVTLAEYVGLVQSQQQSS